MGNGDAQAAGAVGTRQVEMPGEKYGYIRKEKVLTNRQGLFYNEMYF